MATVINNPNPNPSYAERPVLTETRERSGVGFIVGLVLAVILAILLLAYGIPALIESMLMLTGPRLSNNRLRLAKNSGLKARIFMAWPCCF